MAPSKLHSSRTVTLDSQPGCCCCCWCRDGRMDARRNTDLGRRQWPTCCAPDRSRRQL